MCVFFWKEMKEGGWREGRFDPFFTWLAGGWVDAMPCHAMHPHTYTRRQSQPTNHHTSNHNPPHQPPPPPPQVDIWAATKEDFGRWFGWVESRLRLLILALEQPPLLHAYPLADFLPNPPPPAEGGQEGQGQEGQAGGGVGLQGRVSFFVALCFDAGVLNYDVSGAVQDFLLKVSK